MANIPTSVYITHLEREGSFIKVWGQTDRSLPIAIEKALQQMTPHFEQGMYSPAIENFQVGIMCCAKFKDDLYYRARITNVSYLTQGMVEVLFVDYGNRDIISCINTRTMSGLQTGLISIPAQAKDFVLANVTLHNWDLNNFEMICSELRYLEFQFVPVLEVGPYTLISLYSNKQDITESLVERGLLLKIPIQFQQITLQPLIARNAPPGLSVPPHQLPLAVTAMQPKIAPVTQPVPTPTLLTYKALPLDNESEHQIYVSYVSDGPCLFSVQLKKMEEQLKRLMTEINCMELQSLEEYPLPGTVCLAQSSEDGYICRAVVTSMVDGQYKVFYVDFGNTELLPFDKLFQIPFKYVIPKVMATRFALAGLENATVSIEMKCKFKEFVNNRPLYMRVKPAATKSALPLCELWDENGIKSLDMIRQAALLSYPEAAPLSRGVNQEVKVSFVYSCNKIFVQLKTKENDLKQLMNSLQQTCHSRPLFNINDLKIGAPCCAMFADDSMWYRSEIQQIDSDFIKIKYVDFGNENVVSFNDLKVPLPEHITALRPQAIECCLNGYQNIEPDEHRDILLEELILEQNLSMRVVEIQGSRALVDLYDKQHYNVASLLLEKIANTTSMVSPLLIQDNHRIEQRKRSPPQGNQRDFREKKPLRELNDRNRDNRQENWRQNKFSRNNSDDNWNDQPQTEKQDRFQKTNNRNNESEWDESEQNIPENRNSFHHGNKRFDEQRGRNLASRDNSEQGSTNDDRDTKDNENKNLFPRGGRRNGFNSKDSFNKRDGENRNVFEKRNGFGKRDGFERKDDFEKRNGFQRNDGFEKKEGFAKRDGFERKDGFGKRDGFDRKEGFGKRDGFEKKEGFKKFNRNQSGSEYGKSNRNYNDSRSSDEGSMKTKGRDFKKDGSEKSWSDASEKSWRKGPRTFNKQRGGNFGYSPKVQNNEATLQNDDWVTGAASTNDNVTYDYANETDKFETYRDLSGSNETVSISWFYNPINFYCQLNNNKLAFKEMMEEIQTSYRSRKTTKANPGAPVIVPFSEDGALYRAEVLSCQFNQYHVKYVDYGNVATVNRVYPIEKKYMTLPAQAIPCGLHEIAPLGDTWPDPDTFSPYFNKDSFNCQFITFLENRYLVGLNCDGKDVSSLLNEASLAVSTESTTNIDISLLINQQIMIVLRDVVSLNDITIEIQGVAAKASMHNLTTSTETYEDNLKQWIGHYLIMFVDNILEDKIEITLYDLTGQKLQILTPDEGAYDTVEPLCPLPIYSEVIQGWVSYASAESIYIQPSQFSETIAQLLETLYGHYSSLTQEEAVTPAEGQVYAVLSSDSNWYRGSITEIKEGGVVVTFVDYGNSELVSVANLRELSPLFYQPHMLAVEVFVPGDKEQYLEQEITVSLIYGCLGWEGAIISENDEAAEVDPPQSTEVKTELEEAIIPPSTSSQEDFVPEGEEASSPAIGVHVVISHIDTPSEFYLQHSDASESISLLQEELQEHIPNLANLENPTAGVLCAAPYSVCQQWFRAQVLDADDDITTVRFVDFGNTDVITNANVHVKTLPSEMLSIEYHAKLCSLFAKPVGEEWSAAAIDTFENYVSVENLTAEIIHQDEKTTYVELYANGKNVGDMLKEEGLATDLHIETESSSTGFISHLNSPSEFWIQLESSCSDLEWVADQLANAESYPALEDLTPGSLCAAIFSDDDSWYRARILSNTVAGLEVIFIDYGNSCSCNGLRELPEDLIMLPPLALKCSLQKPNGILQWSHSATEKFKEISADGATVFNVNILTPGETSIVQLTHEGQDISMQLVPETRQCFVCTVDSVDSFWVQFMDDNVKIENMAEALELAESWPDLTDAEDNSLVAVLFVDGVWYRAKILEKSADGYEALFIDYGNTSVVTNLKQLPDEYAKIEPLASNFKLDLLPRTKWGDKSNELFRSMTECGVAMFDLELVSEDMVRLYLNGVDIRPSLECIKCTPTVSLQSSPKKMPTEIEQPKIEIDDNHSVDIKKLSQETAIARTQSADLEKFSGQQTEIEEDHCANMEELAQQQEEIDENQSEDLEELPEQQQEIDKNKAKDVKELPQQQEEIDNNQSEDVEERPQQQEEILKSQSEDVEELPQQQEEINKNQSEDVEEYPQQQKETPKSQSQDVKEFPQQQVKIDKNQPVDIEKCPQQQTDTDENQSVDMKIQGEGDKQNSVLEQKESISPIKNEKPVSEIKDIVNVTTMKMVENHLENIIDNVVSRSHSSEELPKDTNRSKIIETDKITNDSVDDLIIDNCKTLSEQKDDETASPLKSDETTFDTTKCDITNQETSIHETNKPLDSLVVKDTSNQPTEPNQEVTNTLECDKTLEASEIHKEKPCTEDGKIITESSDTGHSPKKDELSGKVKLEEK